MAYYGADITTYMSLETKDAKFTNVEEFLEDGRYKLQTIQYSALHMHLQVQECTN